MIKVLVVDDSSFFRRRITEFLSSHPDLEVIGQAVDGQEALTKFAQLKPDLITMDIEMPRMNGIEAVRQIRAKDKQVPILMFSSLTHEGATATFEALDAGASDFLPKKFEEIAQERSEAVKKLCERIVSLAKKSGSRLSRDIAVPPAIKSVARATSSGYQLVAIGASTGGPIAIEKVLKTLPANFPLPILLTQHMPSSFTGAFADRLDKICKVNVKEAADGDMLMPGKAYIAPGGRQMRVKREGRQYRIIVNDEPAVTTYKPSVDITFDSIAKQYSGRVLAIVLTGMGSDGCQGSRALREKGATVWAQDEASCVVYGMPQAVVKEKLADKIMSVDEIGLSLSRH